MPRVPTLQRTVTRKPLPAARLTNVPSANAFGKQLGDTLAGIGAQQVTSILARTRQAADELVILEAGNKMATEERRLLYGDESGQGGLLSREGKDSFGIPEEFLTAYTKFAGEVGATLSSDAQRQAFARLTASAQQRTALALHRHVFDERQKFDTTETQTFLEGSVSAAALSADDPAAVNVELTAGLEEINRHVDRMGMGEDAAAAMRLDYTTAVHQAVISRLLAMEKDRLAEIYFEGVNKEEISAAVQTKIIIDLEEGTLRGESQKKTDELILESASIQEAFDKSLEIKDDKLRDATRDRLRQRLTDERIATNARQEKALNAATDILERTQDIGSIPPSMWTDFSTTERARLKAYVKEMKSPTGVTTDRVFWDQLIRQSTEDADAFAERNLAKEKHRLSESDFQQLTLMQQRIRGGAAPRDTLPAGFATKTQVLDGIYRDFDIRRGSRAGDQLIEDLDRAIDAAQGLTRKELTNTEVREFADRIMTEIVLERGSIFNALPGGRFFGPLTDQTKRAGDINLTDIPPDELDALRQKLIADGREPTRDALLQLFIRGKIAAGEFKKK